MHIHILGICGTFMGGIAVLAKQQGHQVTGSDVHVYPPMSTQLTEQGIALTSGYDASYLELKPDCVIVGNAMSRGNPAVEALLNSGLPYTSCPQWLAENSLAGRWVLAVSGTHGKTTTTSILAWILESAGLNPGFLIGGVPNNFGISARFTDSNFFVIEADEYDSAFFDKRSKFIHYKPRTLIINNLEYDHADIFPDLAAIQRQFHHLVRTVPSQGMIIAPKQDAHVAEVLQQGRWTPIEYIDQLGDIGWRAELMNADGSAFKVYCNKQFLGEVEWSLLGQHNVHNALAAIAAARHVGILPEQAIAALTTFQNVKRRLEVRGQVAGITIYDDFAHHPTAIATTLNGLRKRVGKQRIIAVLEMASNTMRSGVHKQALAPALAEADKVLLAKPKMQDWGIDEVANTIANPAQVFASTTEIIDDLVKITQAGDHILIMSNAGFDGIHEKLLAALQA